MRDNIYNLNEDRYSTRIETLEKINFMIKEVE